MDVLVGIGVSQGSVTNKAALKFFDPALVTEIIVIFGFDVAAFAQADKSQDIKENG
jgi:hypothetical protein